MFRKNAVGVFYLSFLIACQPIEETLDISKPAEQYIGLDEYKNRKQLKELVGVDPVHTEWCAAFVNFVLDIQNIPGSESVSDYPLMARSFLTWGEEVLDKPKKGDIIIFPRGDKLWQGHVGFFIKEVRYENKIRWIILGGNQDNTVSYAEFNPKKAIAIRRKSVN